MNERDVVFIPLGPKHSLHPGVVVKAENDKIIVVRGGTGTARDLPRVVVQANSRGARALGLYKDTCFYESNVIATLPNVVRPTTFHCPPDLFLRLRGMADEVIDRVGIEGLLRRGSV